MPGIYGFGQDGPYAAQPAYDDLIQGGCGLAWLMGGRAGDGTPRYVASAVADRVVGLRGDGRDLRRPRAPHEDRREASASMSPCSRPWSIW